MKIEDLKPGMRVVFIDERLNCGGPGDRFGAPETDAGSLAGRELLVVAVQPGNQEGKVVAVATKKSMVGGHTCDGLIPDGHGRWVLPEQLYTTEEYMAHAKACSDWAKKQKAAKAMVESFLEE